MLLRRHRRTGSTLVESAFVYPVLFLIVAAIVTLGLTVFRYQQTAHAAGEAAGYASVHGVKYAQDPDVLRFDAAAATATEDSIYAKVVSPMVPWVDRSGVTVSWNTSAAQARTAPGTDGAGQSVPVTVQNTVTVTVTYTWDTGWFGSIPVSSTSVAVMQF